MPEIVGEYIDKIANVEMLDDTQTRRNRTHLLYEAATMNPHYLFCQPDLH